MRINLISDPWIECNYRFSHWSFVVFPSISSFYDFIADNKTSTELTFNVPSVDSILITANFVPID